MSAYNVVRAIVVFTGVLLVGLFLLAGKIWPQVAGNNGNNLVIALPVIGGVAIVAPLILKALLRR